MQDRMRTVFVTLMLLMSSGCDSPEDEAALALLDEDVDLESTEKKLAADVERTLDGADVEEIAAVPSVATNTDCGDGKFCAWTWSYYTGTKYSWDCSNLPWANIGMTMYSAKNRCGQKTIRIGWTEYGYINWKKTLHPGESAPDPGRFNFVLY